MNCQPKCKVVFMGSKQAGMVGLLSLVATEDVIAVVAYDNIVRQLTPELGIKMFVSVHDEGLLGYLVNSDLLVSVHGREIVPDWMLKLTRLGAINVHPCLYKYKGVRPIPRMLEDKESRASVGVHWMTDRVDEGAVIVENYQNVLGRTPEEVYNELYPLYVKTLLEAMAEIMCGVRFVQGERNVNT